MASFKRTITMEISKEELESIIKQHFKVPQSAKVSFVLREQSDYMDRYSSTVFSCAQLSYEEQAQSNYQGPG
jgi:hypothetical protein